MLEVLNLTKKYKKLVANDHICFQVCPGEIAILLGPNGAGKSTAVKCIAGLLRFDGDIKICGVPNKTVAAKQQFGYIPEFPAPFDNLTLMEHLEFIGRAYRIKNWKERAYDLLERMEMTAQEKKLGRELSKGMQQKLNICCALMIQPRVLLLDEPFVGLDPHAIKELKTILTEYKAAGTAILLSTHMIDSVKDLWDKALIMMNGRIVAVRTYAELTANGETLEELFFSITEGGERQG